MNLDLFLECIPSDDNYVVSSIHPCLDGPYQLSLYQEGNDLFCSTIGFIPKDYKKIATELFEEIYGKNGLRARGNLGIHFDPVSMFLERQMNEIQMERHKNISTEEALENLDILLYSDFTAEEFIKKIRKTKRRTR